MERVFVNVWAIVPVKPLNRAKSRLAPVLHRARREYLATAMLRHVVALLARAPEIAGVLVISRDPHALSDARALGAQTVQESGAPELNDALTRAAQVTRTLGATATLVLPADLPLIAPEDVAGIVRLACEGGSVVLAPDRHEDGTNALLMRPPGVIPYAFGAGSFGQHLLLAEEAGAGVHVWQSPRVTLDVDTPDDLACYRALAEELGEPLLLPELPELSPRG
jgi:2-phospho-L-lactate guanylyltransferase